MSTLTLFDYTISDGTTSLTLTIQRDLGSDALPVVFVVDGAPLGLPLELAAKLAPAGERIEQALFKAKEAPKESSTVFAYKLGFADGTVGPFELAITEDPLGVSFVWGAKRLALGLDSIADLLWALSQIGVAVGDIRRAALPPPGSTPSASPAPGRRWETWQPRCAADIGPVGQW